MPTGQTSVHSEDKRARRSREAIVGATIRLVSRAGSEVSVAEIAHEAGVSRRAVYLNYETRDNVLLASVAHLLRSAFPEHDISAARVDGDEPPELLRDLAGHLLAHRDFYATVLTGPSAHHVQRHVLDTFAPDVAGIMGTDRPDHDIHFVMYGIIGLCTEALTTAGPTDAEAVAATIWCTLRRIR